MELNYSGIVMIVLGCLVILFREQLAHYAIEFQNKNFGIKTSKRLVKLSIQLTPLFGLLFILIGVLILLEIGW